MSQQFNIETVADAQATPDVEQPWAELGLKENEYAEIKKILGRRPTAAELAMYSVMWSEHCSYKSSKVHLRQFGEKLTDEMKQHMMVGIGENAGVTDLGDGWAVTFKVESGPGSLGGKPTATVTTGADGTASVGVQAGGAPGGVVVSATAGSLRTTFELGVTPIFGGPAPAPVPTSTARGRCCTSPPGGASWPTAPGARSSSPAT